MAIDAGLFVGWNRPVPGKEKISTELFETFLGYLHKLQSDGHIDSYEPVMVTPHGGDLNGFILVRGERDKLDRVAASNEFMSFQIKGQIVLDELGVIHCHVGEGVKRFMDQYKKSI